MRGLVNHGNNCYFNASIQVLAHIPILANSFIKTPYEGPCSFTREFSEFIHKFWRASPEPRKPLDPLAMIREFRKHFPRFRDDEQHDVQECVLCIIDIIERAVPRVKEWVYGTKTQETHWPGGSSKTKDPFCVHILTHDRSGDLGRMLENASKWNAVEGYEDSDGQKHHVATTRTVLTETPKVLFISFDKKSHVDAVEHLSFSNGSTYRLVASAVHAGAQFTGHYMAFTKHGGKWSFRDDEICRECELEKTAGPYFMAYARQKTP
mgnify:FL=1